LQLLIQALNECVSPCCKLCLEDRSYFSFGVVENLIHRFCSGLCFGKIRIACKAENMLFYFFGWILTPAAN